MTALCPGPVATDFADVGGLADADSAMPKIFWVAKETVAEAAVDGLAHNRAVVIPGAVNRAGAVAASLTPRRILLPMLARYHPALGRR